jgi:hypothetical protein
MIASTENVAIDFQKVQSLAANSKRIAVLIENNCVEEAITKYSLHDHRCIGGEIGISNRFHGRERTHSAERDEIICGAFDPRLISSLVAINMKDHHWGLYQEGVNELARMAAGRVCECASRACIAHASDLTVHPGPVKAQADPVQGTSCVEMSAQEVAVEHDKDEVAKVRRHQLQTSIGFGPHDRFLQDKNTIFECNLRLAQSGAVSGAQFRLLEALCCHCAQVLHEPNYGSRLGVIQVSLGPLVGRWQTDTNGAIEECLDAYCRGGVLIWLKNFKVTAAYLYAPVEDMIKNPCQCKGADSGI